jgi:hypothetical protein
MILQLLRDIFPNIGVVLFSLSWIAVSMIASTLFNNQDLENKKLNALKSFLLIAFAMSWATVATYNTTGEWTPAFAVFGIIVWVFYLIGDWLAYWGHQLRFSPGGLQGWIWFGIAKRAKELQATANRRAVASLRPTERKLYDAQVAEQHAAALASLVDVVPGAKVIVTPPPLAALLGGVKKMAITPAVMISQVPEATIVAIAGTMPGDATPIVPTRTPAEVAEDQADSGETGPAVPPVEKIVPPPQEKSP